MDRRTDEQTDRRTDGQTDRQNLKNTLLVTSGICESMRNSHNSCPLTHAEYPLLVSS